MTDNNPSPAVGRRRGWRRFLGWPLYIASLVTLLLVAFVVKQVQHGDPYFVLDTGQTVAVDPDEEPEALSMRIRGLEHTLDVKLNGWVAFTEDESDVAVIAPDAEFVISIKGPEGAP